MAKEFIEREAAKSYPIRLNHYDKKNGNIDFVLGIESVLEYIDELPAADVVEVVHGEWIEDCDRIVHCSVCKVARNNFLGVGGSLWHYCPNCGAKMDGERRCEDG